MLRTEADVVASLAGQALTIDEIYDACRDAGVTSRDGGDDIVWGRTDTRWKRRARGALQHLRSSGRAHRGDARTWIISGTRTSPRWALLILADGYSPIEVRLCDAEELLGDLAHGGPRVDLIIADPPWALGRDGRHRTYARDADRVIDGYVDVDPGAYREFTARWAAAAAAVLQAHPGAYLAAITGPQQSAYVQVAAEDAGLSFVNQIVVHRPFSLPTSRRYSHAHTTVTVLASGRPEDRHFVCPDDLPKARSGRDYPLDWWADIAKYERRGLLRYDNALAPDLVARLVSSYTPGPEQGAAAWSALVADPFCGSGTTAAVCAQLERRCVTGDLNPESVRFTLARLIDEPLPVTAAAGSPGAPPPQSRLATSTEPGTLLVMDWDAIAAGKPAELDGSTGDAVLDALAGCPQSATHHAEGDVATHTNMVVDAAAEALDARGVTGRAAEVVRIAALLHDVGKPATTVETAPCEYSSPKHAEVGAEIVNTVFDAQPQLRRRGLADRAAVFAAVRAHMWAWHPENVSVGSAVRTAHLVDLGHLAALWSADAAGRISADAAELTDRVAWAELVISELVGGQLRDPYPHISAVCDPYELEPRVRRSVLRAVVTGQVTTPGAAAAHIAAAERETNGAHIMWMCGPPGSGKSTWAKKWADRNDAVVLTVAGGRRRDRDVARGHNRQALIDIVSAGGRVVIDATHVTRDSRDRFCTLAGRYGARLEGVIFDTPTATCVARQRDRAPGTAVPAATVAAMAATLRWPTPDEYDTLTVVDATGEQLWTPESRELIGQNRSRR